MSMDRGGDDEPPRTEPPKGRPANAAPDAVRDPNEKTGGKPGLGPQGGDVPEGGTTRHDEIDPGGG